MTTDLTYPERKLQQLLPLVVGITKKDIALQLDKFSPLFNFSSETGLTSYRNYTRNDLLIICINYRVDPVSDYHKNRAGIDWMNTYFETYFSKP